LFANDEKVTVLPAGVMTMLDVVLNHVGPIQQGDSLFDPSSVIPFNKPEHYHTCIEGCMQGSCSIPLSAYAEPPNELLYQTCRVAHLPDLNQTVPEVKQQLLSWIHTTLRKFKFDGVRVDTVKHVANVSG
jgi:alpha-amylase